LWLTFSSSVLAQEAAIAGTVRDASGGVLPGVVVEASSPSLIEKTRSATTDGLGQYRIVNLVPGTYTVTFTLSGFSVVRRESIELRAETTVPLNAEMKVGALEETITVTGATPVVDVQNVAARTVMTREVMDAIPQGRNIQAIGIMIPGTGLQVGGGGALSRDVGGSGMLQQSPLSYRGSAASVQTVEGMRLNNLCGSGQYSGNYWNDGMFQEVSYSTGADSAEMGQGGLRINMIPRDGGNTFRGNIRRRLERQQPDRRSRGAWHHERQPDLQGLRRQPDVRRPHQTRSVVVPGHLPAPGPREDSGRQLFRRRS
jgi:hypothetical protein